MTIDDPRGTLDLAADWDPKRATPDRPLTVDEIPSGYDSVLALWNGDKCIPLARFPHRSVGEVKLSPDGKWVAVSTIDLQRERNQLFAYAVGSHRLYCVDNDAAPCVCFTGPHRLAYVSVADGTGPGVLGETDLDEATTELHRSSLVDVLPLSFGFLTPVQTPGNGVGLLFLAEKATLPRKTQADSPGTLQPMTLFRWDRGAGGLTELADHILSMSLSPNGKTLLCLVDAGDKNWIELLDPDGTHPRQLIEADKKKIPVLPTWHGNDKITLTRPASPAGTDPETFDLIDRTVTPDGKFGPPIDLSRDWGDRCRKPWYSDTSKVQ